MSFLTFPSFLQTAHFDDGVDGLFFGGTDEAAGIDQYDFGVGRLLDHLKMVSLQQSGHDLGVDQVTGAAETDDTEFLFFQ